MGKATIIYMLGVLLLVSGCTTSSQVKNLIKESDRNYLDQSKAHEASIVVLKQSSMASLEMGNKQAEALIVLQKQLKEAVAQLNTIQGSSEAAKVMSAVNAVKVADLGDDVLHNKDAIDATIEKMAAIDVLFEEVLVRYYQAIAEGAQAAIAALQADDVETANGSPVGLAEPIEILAPDTSGQATLTPAK